jgi:hypothetical protein
VSIEIVGKSVVAKTGEQPIIRKIKRLHNTVRLLLKKPFFVFSMSRPFSLFNPQGG